MSHVGPEPLSGLFCARTNLPQAKHRGPTKAEMAGYKEVMKMIIDDSRVTPQEVREMIDARKRRVVEMYEDFLRISSEYRVRIVFFSTAKVVHLYFRVVCPPQKTDAVTVALKGFTFTVFLHQSLSNSLVPTTAPPKKKIKTWP